MRTQGARRNAGFTIVELIVVVILFAILAITALPRFLDSDKRNDAAVFEGVLGGFQTGVTLFQAQWMATEQPYAGTPFPKFRNLRATARGYPYGTDKHPDHLPAASRDCAHVFLGLLGRYQDGLTIAHVDEVAQVSGSHADFTAVRSGSNCLYYYTAMGSASGTLVPILNFAATTGAVTEGKALLP